MAVKETCAVLFILSLMVFPSYISCNELCTSPDENVKSDKNFTITVSPEKLMPNNEYTVTVTVNVSGDVTLNLRAISSSVSVGNWKDGNNCSGGPLFENAFNGSVGSKVAYWNSTNSSAPVEISALISKSPDIFKVSVVLKDEPTVAPNTTVNTNDTTATAGNTTQAPAGNTTQATTISTTAGSGSVVRPSSMLMALIQAFGFLVISVKLLS